MSIRIVRLGSAREGGEGLRIATVRRPPRGVPKAQFSSNYVAGVVDTLEEDLGHP